LWVAGSAGSGSSGWAVRRYKKGTTNTAAGRSLDGTQSTTTLRMTSGMDRGFSAYGGKGWDHGQKKMVANFELIVERPGTLRVWRTSVAEAPVV